MTVAEEREALVADSQDAVLDAKVDISKAFLLCAVKASGELVVKGSYATYTEAMAALEKVKGRGVVLSHAREKSA